MENNVQNDTQYDDEIDLRELFGVLLAGSRKIIAITAVFAFVSVIYALSVPNQYKAITLLAPAQHDSSDLTGAFGQMGGLASLAGVSIGSESSEAKTAQEIMQSWSFIEGFIAENNIAVEVYAAEEWSQVSDKLQINDNLSVNGFIDGSINKVDSQTVGQDTANWGLDEVEVNFLLNVGSVSGTIALDSQNIGQNTTDGDDIEIEQAHFTYSLDNGVSLTLGRYGSGLGLEGEDPAGLYTYSRAYSGTNNPFNFGNIDDANGSVEGLIIAYAAENWSVQVSIDNPSGTIRESGSSKNDLDYEVALSYTGIENLNLGLGFRANDALSSTNVKTDSDIFNVNGTYQVGKALIGAEYSEISATGTADLDAMMILVDYDVSDKLGLAVRYSTFEESASVDVDKITIAPNYAITESLGAILEYSDISHDTAGSDSDEIALELTYTF